MIMMILFVLFVILQLLDIHTTVCILRAGGRELNPLLAPLMKRFGVMLTLILTKAAAIALVYTLFQFPDYWWVMAGIVVYYVALVARNFRVALKMGVDWTPF